MQIGSTVHVVPVEGGLWQVVDPLRRDMFTSPSMAAAVERAKSVAARSQPSQVVLLDKFGRFIPSAHYQLPEYPNSQIHGKEGSVFEAAVKTLVISGLIGAGVAVLGEVVDRVERELQEGASKPKSKRRSRK